ncbi:unnamed protein product [Cercospora beticola]|nr:unnamed protein product [Cercospora beticola]
MSQSQTYRYETCRTMPNTSAYSETRPRRNQASSQEIPFGGQNPVLPIYIARSLLAHSHYQAPASSTLSKLCRQKHDPKSSNAPAVGKSSPNGGFPTYHSPPAANTKSTSASNAFKNG